MPNHDGSSKLREFNVGDTVYIQNFRCTSQWIPAVVNKCHGSVSYTVKLNDGTIVKWYVDHVKACQPSDDIIELGGDFYTINGRFSDIPVPNDESQALWNYNLNIFNIWKSLQSKYFYMNNIRGRQKAACLQFPWLYSYVFQVFLSIYYSMDSYST